MAKKTLILDLILTCLMQIWAPNFFLGVLPLLVVKHYFKLSSYAIYRKTSEPNFRKWQKKTNFGSDFGLIRPKFGPPIFFSWMLPLLDAKHCSKL